MEVIEEKAAKLSFSGHESFQCRQLWLKKGYDFIKAEKLFNDNDAVVTLGVGKNMVSSIRYWMKAFNILDTKDAITEFGHKMFDTEKGWDPFLEDETSLWLLHYQLVKTNLASIYNIIFNDFRKEKITFNKDSFLSYMKRKKDAEQFNYNENTVAEDFGVFIKMYQVNGVNTKDIEDSFSGVLSELELLRTYDAGKNEVYQIENNDKLKINDVVILFSILDNSDYGKSVSFNSLELDNNGPCSIFAINRNSLTNKLHNIASAFKGITFTDHAGIKELQFKNKNLAYDILDQYYGK